MNKRISETKVYHTLREKVFNANKYRVNRVENVLVAGMFDVNYCLGEDCEGWIEIKAPIEPKRKTTKLFGSNHKLSQDQKNWCLSQRQAGGRAFILIATDKRWMLIHGDHVDKLNDLTVEELIEISVWHEEKPITGADKWWKLLICLAHL